MNDPDKGQNPFGGNDKQPPDLDEALRRLQEKLKQTFSGKGSTGGSSGSDNSSGGLFIGMLAIIFVALWALSGIFIVAPAERAVVLYFGKYKETVEPGPHWIPRGFASKVVLDVDRVMDYSYSAQMLTKDENLVDVALVVQYRIGDIEKYLFNVVDPSESLQQATSSALREVVGTKTLDEIITSGREQWGIEVDKSLHEILKIYDAGIVIVNVAPQPARAPESVQEAFDDAIKAQEDEKRFIEQARAYEARVVPIAKGRAERILQEAQGKARQLVLRAEGEVAGFLALLPEYKQAPEVMTERMYLDTMTQVLSSTSKIIVDSKAGNLLYLPLDKLGSMADVMKSQHNDSVADTEPSESQSPLLPYGRNSTRTTYRQERG